MVGLMFPFGWQSLVAAQVTPAQESSYDLRIHVMPERHSMEVHGTWKLPDAHAHLAQDSAQEAIELAKSTENRRLLAYAYIWQGLTHRNRFFNDLESGRLSYDQAVTMSKGVHAEGAWDDLRTLNARVLRAAGVTPILRTWSQGSVGDKTFQQITEEFAELIIPKVWEREGRKISRVATRLSISPKRFGAPRIVPGGESRPSSKTGASVSAVTTIRRYCCVGHRLLVALHGAPDESHRSLG